jgi:hypothetical protein
VLFFFEDEIAVDIDFFHLGLGIQGMAIEDEDIGILHGFEASDTVGDPED